MRILRFIVPVAIAGALIAGCGDPKAADNTPTAPATTAPADNGIKDLSADEILKKAATALKDAGSFAAKGEVTSDGEKTVVDVKVKGNDATGTITMGGLGTIKVLVVGGVAYFQADEVFWKTFGGANGATMATLFKGKWVKSKAGDQLSSLSNSFTPEEMLKPEGTATKGEIKTVNGVQAIALIDSKDNGKIYIATTGKPVPVRIEDADGKGGIDFTNVGTVTDEIKAPPADQIVDLAALGGK